MHKDARKLAPVMRSVRRHCRTGATTIETMEPSVLSEFANYRAKHRPSDYIRFIASNQIGEAWLKEEAARGPNQPSFIPEGAVNAYEWFIAQEGRAKRRLIDVPDPAYTNEGYAELNSLVDRILSSRHEGSIKALIASLGVDLDWITFLIEGGDDYSQTARIEHRLLATIERAVAGLENYEHAESLLYRPSLLPISVAAQAVSDALVEYIARNPSALHELRPRQFEELIAHILEGFGWEVELTPETRDGGYDILAVSKDLGKSGIRTSYLVECKKYRQDRKVGITVARQLLQVKSELRASHAIIATTSDFSVDLYRFASQRLDLDPRNAQAIIDWCKGHRSH